MARATLSVVILTLNEEERIEAALRSVRWADEIIVMDCGSVDRTVPVAAEGGARIFERAFTDFADQHNSAVAHATMDWILSLDADERVSEDLSMEIRTVLEGSTPHSGFEIPFRNHIGDRWMRRGGLYPDRHLRLFRRRCGRFAGRIHEKIHLDGSIGRLRGSIDHMTYRDVAHMMEKVERYARLEGSEAARAGIPGIVLLAKVPYRFVSVYLLKRGFADGRLGLVHALAMTRYAWIVFQSASRERRFVPGER